MPFAEISGGSIHYRIDGDADAPVLVLSNSLGTDLSMWDQQVPALSCSFRVLRYDSRGHGRSLVTPGPYSIELLARDVVGLLDRLQIARAHLCGLSLGGMVGMWLAANMPGRVGKLVLANTSARLGPPEAWDARVKTVLQGGMNSIVGTVIERWFTPTFLARHTDDVTAVRQALLATAPNGYMACCTAIRDMDQRGQLASIRSPTLVIAGQHDPATPPAMGRTIADGIRGARFIELPTAHLSNIEAADAFNAAVLDFLLAKG
jgi:3-oxoadipate enol-lactonase